MEGEIGGGVGVGVGGGEGGGVDALVGVSHRSLLDYEVWFC